MAYSIAIAGCGTGGLAAAIFLTRSGHDVTLFEKFDEPKPIGAGLLLQPTGLACLARLGLDKTAIERGSKIDHLHGLSGKSTVFDIYYHDLAPHLFGLGIHRGVLFEILYNEVRNLDIPLQSHFAADSVRETATGKLELLATDGRSGGTFDLVIDAGGLKSALRDKYAPIKYIRPYTYGAVWGVCKDKDRAFGRDKLQQRYTAAKKMCGALGIGNSTSGNEKHIAFFWSLKPQDYAAWKAGGLAPWRDEVLALWPEMEGMVGQFAAPEELTLAFYADVVLKEYHKGRMAFLGDSAHCTSPQLGQGANLALIDAMTLADCLEECESIETALKTYTARRKAHIRFYQTASRWLTPFFQSDSATPAMVRDCTFGLMCKMPFIKWQMLLTLSGVKTGLLCHMNPGRWHEDYDLKRL